MCSSTSFNIHTDSCNYHHKQGAEQFQCPPNIPLCWPFVDRCTSPPAIAQFGKEFLARAHTRNTIHKRKKKLIRLYQSYKVCSFCWTQRRRKATNWEKILTNHQSDKDSKYKALWERERKLNKTWSFSTRNWSWEIDINM